MSVGTYFTKLKGMWDELNALSPTPSCSCGAMTEVLEYQRRQRTMKFLMGLHESYFMVRGDIVSTIHVPEVAALASKSNTNGQRNFKNTDKKKGGTRDRPTCEHCNWVGHTMDKCYALHGYPPGHRLYKATSSATANQAVHSAIEKQHSRTNSFPFTQEQCRQILALIPKSPHVTNQAGSNVSISNLSGNSLCLSSITDSTSWILDSGATDHMVKSSSLLTSIQSLGNSTVRLPNGITTPVTHVGSVDQCSRTMIGMGRERDGLYYFTPSMCTSSQSDQSKPMLWHQRLGHLSNKCLNFLSRNVSGIPCSDIQLCFHDDFNRGFTPRRKPRIRWRTASNGNGARTYLLQFIKSTYSKWKDQKFTEDRELLAVWKNICRQKIELFAWIAIQGCIASKSVLVSKGILNSNLGQCPFCNSAEEALNHLLLQCDVARRIWDNASFYSGIWTIWTCRNELVFRNKIWEMEEISDLVEMRMVIWIKGKYNITDYSIEDFKWNLAGIRTLKF
ncbi:hypothetical protein RHSIM_Rhsim11G0109000 [Rhododendron simsii]|uniref:Reverse transcriptase zinc-binding domain-containing protein n=1 Tax=Rhododendron simsii TaxID=118357 RepID=A0A834G7Y2_RHOSS|nr:hypothetical protein RHSIM_Rhsim11G0109000 [Rhododendron simsii]